MQCEIEGQNTPLKLSIVDEKKNDMEKRFELMNAIISSHEAYVVKELLGYNNLQVNAYYAWKKKNNI
jgi:hypothetical protein